jgi:hypothetical protein
MSGLTLDTAAAGGLALLETTRSGVRVSASGDALLKCLLIGVVPSSSAPLCIDKAPLCGVACFTAGSGENGAIGGEVADGMTE